MEKFFKCPWCGGKMDGEHPVCAGAAEDLASVNADLEEENNRLRAALSMTREGVSADEAMRAQNLK